jgi:hypothetical protein
MRKTNATVIPEFTFAQKKYLLRMQLPATPEIHWSKSFQQLQPPEWNARVARNGNRH